MVPGVPTETRLESRFCNKAIEPLSDCNKAIEPLFDYMVLGPGYYYTNDKSGGALLPILTSLGGKSYTDPDSDDDSTRLAVAVKTTQEDRQAVSSAILACHLRDAV